VKFAIVMSHFNAGVTEGLLQGALGFLEEKGIAPDHVDRFDAPGAFEIPLIAQRLAKTKRYDAVIALGCVIKGDTAHFEFISLSAAIGLMQASLQTEVPIAFGILTAYTDEQAETRSRKNAENKGREAANAAWQTVHTLRKI
jgi:6,7-dimethyl-8-ribityllumazine synthase